MQGDLFADELFGEEKYWGKANKRPEPKIGDRCFVHDTDGDFTEWEVTRITPKFFMASCIDKPGLITLPPGIPKDKFRPKEF